MQNRPKLFSSFMLQLLAELYATLPEVGDMDKPKLVLFIDEAHLIFDDAEKSLLDEIETVIKLIRSKGVGIFFCTQLPTDIPNDVLGQLGMKVQHALRAFTANDRKAIHLVAQNYPETPFYNTEQLLTELGIGEALVTVLDERGAPTPLAATLLCAPRSRMGALTPEELQAVVGRSQLAQKYNTTLDPQSAYEILGGKIATAASPEHAQAMASGERRTFSPAPASAAGNRELAGALGVPDVARRTNRAGRGSLSQARSSRRRATESSGRDFRQPRRALGLAQCGGKRHRHADSFASRSDGSARTSLGGFVRYFSACDSEFLERDKLQRGRMRRLEIDRRRHAAVERFFPARHANAPSIARLQPRETPLRMRCDEIVSHQH